MEKLYIIEAHTGDWEDRVDVTLFATPSQEQARAVMAGMKDEAMSVYYQMRYNTYQGLPETFGIDMSNALHNFVCRATYNNFMSLRLLTMKVGTINAPVMADANSVVIDFPDYNEQEIESAIDEQAGLPYNKYEELGEQIEAKFR